MRDRLAKIMADSTQSTIKFKLANPLPKNILVKSKLTTEEKDQDAMLKIILDDYESREKFVMIENQRLRDLLAQLYQCVETCTQQMAKHVGRPQEVTFIDIGCCKFV